MTEISKKVIYTSVTFGCDPELFLSNGEKIIGSERVIPANGILGDPNYGTGNKSIQDGVQLEINPTPSTCRQSLAGNIGAIFRQLNHHLVENGKGAKLSFDAVVTVDKEELDALSEKARKLGCQPSQNFYDAKATINVDPDTYDKRSAGGHIHLGLGSQMLKHRSKLVPVLDVVLGNTCVLIDRDPNAAERRQVYGRAGEHRLPRHGLEYRTLSNFWLRSYQLMSLVMGLSRLATCIVGTYYNNGIYDNPPWDAGADLLKRVNLNDIRDAINNNDLDLAQKNFSKVREFIGEYVNPIGTGLDRTNLAQFDYFVQKVQEKGLEYWFPQDPVEHWVRLNTSVGAERFLAGKVAGEMKGSITL